MDMTKTKHSSNFRKLLVCSIQAVDRSKSINLSTVTKLFLKYQELISSFKTEGDLGCLESFIYLYEVLNINNISTAVDTKWVKEMFTTVMGKMKDWTAERARLNQMAVKKFIVVVIQMEALCDDNEFPLGKQILQYFKTKICTKEKVTSGWPELLLKTLLVCGQPHDSDGAQELHERVR